MKVTVLKERRQGETRVAATPETVKKMVAMGLDVCVEKGAGFAASFTDEAYKQAGATLTLTPHAALKDGDILLKVRPPLLKGEGEMEELSGLKNGALLLSILSPHHNTKGLAAYAKAQVSAVALDLIPRISRAQSMDVLSSQANLAGYRVVLEACFEYGRAFPMMMTAAGTVVPAKVLIVGAGVAGLQAIATARRLGAVVSAFDVRAAAKEQVESLGAKFIDVDPDAATSAETAGGYAKEMSAAYLKRQGEKLAQSVAMSDIVITTALIPGKPAPRLLTSAMVKSMKPGSVIVDMAVEMGGNVEGSILDQITPVQGVKIIGYGNLPGRIAAEASTLYARNLFNLLTLILSKDSQKISLDLTDDILKGALVTHNGAVIHPDFHGKITSVASSVAASERSFESKKPVSKPKTAVKAKTTPKATAKPAPKKATPAKKAVKKA